MARRRIFGLPIGREVKEKRSAVDAVLQTPSSGLTFSSIFQQASPLQLASAYRCVNLIADSIASLPVYVTDAENNTIKDHAFIKALNNKNNLLTRSDLIKNLVRNIIIKGNAFCYVNRNADGSVKSLRYLEPGDVNIFWNKTTQELYYTSPLISAKKIEPINMVHLRMFSYDGVNGISILNSGAKPLKMAATTEQSAQAFFDSGCNLSGVLSVNSSLTPQQILDIKKAWRETYTDQNGGLCVLQGNMTFSPTTTNAAEAQMVEAREYNTTEICRLFGINPILLGISTGASYGSIEQAQREFVYHTLMPYIINIEDELTRKCLPYKEEGYQVNLDENSILRGDKTSEATYYTQLLEKGIITPNEARTALGYQPKEGGDDLRIAYTDAAQNKLNQDTQNEGNQTDK